MTVGDRIKASRTLVGITQEELGACCGASKQTIFKYESGVITNIPMDKLEAMAVRLNVSPAYLMGWDNIPNVSEIPDADLDNELVALLTELQPNEIPLIIAYIRGIIAARTKDGEQ